MTDRLEILGFGVEIAGELPEMRRVARAHDLEGAEREWVEPIGSAHAIAQPIGYATPCVTRLLLLSLRTAVYDSFAGSMMG